MVFRDWLLGNRRYQLVQAKEELVTASGAIDRNHHDSSVDRKGGRVVAGLHESRDRA